MGFMGPGCILVGSVLWAPVFHVWYMMGARLARGP